MWLYYSSMATVKVKSTYSLDVETVRHLEGLAKCRNTSKSAALCRAIQAAAKQALPVVSNELDALSRLQRLLALDSKSAAAWKHEVRKERRAATEATER